MKTCLMEAAGLVVFAALCSCARLESQVPIMRTQETIGQIIVAMDQTLHDDVLHEYSPLPHVLSRFPDASNDGAHLLDAWGNAIQVSIAVDGEMYRVLIRSAGPDNALNTADDVTRAFTMTRSVSGADARQ